MEHRTCQHCEATFAPHNADLRVKFCTHECRRAHYRAIKDQARLPECKNCGAPIVGRRRNAQSCSNRCNVTTRQAERRRAARSGLQCDNCGIVFNGVRKDQRFCATRCRNRFHHLMNQYGMSHEDFQNLLARQNHRCGICDESKHQWHIDHCHDTGNVRGVLCHQCNVLLGYARDNVDTLRRAIDYLT